MEFWDSSALLPLVVHQRAFSLLCRRALVGSGPRAVAFLARIECRSGLARLVRDGVLTDAERDRASRALDALLARFDVVAFSSTVEQHALDLLVRHGLRALDAMQLGCALALRAGRHTLRVSLACCDRRLARAARGEQLDLLIVPPAR